MSTLRTAGLIAYPQDGALTLTNEGRKAANWPEDVLTDAELHRKVMSKISGPQGTLLKMLIANYPEAMSREELAVAANVSANSSGFEKNVSTLRSIGLVDYPEKGSVVTTKILFI